MPQRQDDNLLQLPGWTTPAWVIILVLLVLWLVGCAPLGVLTDDAGLRGCLSQSQEYRCD